MYLKFAVTYKKNLCLTPQKTHTLYYSIYWWYYIYPFVCFIILIKHTKGYYTNNTCVFFCGGSQQGGWVPLTAEYISPALPNAYPLTLIKHSYIRAGSIFSQDDQGMGGEMDITHTGQLE